MQPDIIDVKNRFLDSPDGLVLRKTQEIPDWYLDQLQDDKFDTISTPAGDMHRVCSIPAVLYEQWLAEGFDIHREPVREIMKRLKQASLDKFITTAKRI